MNLVSYKLRTLDPAKKIRIYRNLNKSGVVYSVQQAGKVIGYTTEFYLKDCTCYVNQTAVERVRANKVREVHAWIEGYLTGLQLPTAHRLSYNPYKSNFFYNIETYQQVVKAPYMAFNATGVHY
jgi:hypothetical protein